MGFISPELTSQLLKLQGVGSFLFRFDGTGGISIVVLEAEAGIVSHPLDFDMISSPLSLISLIQRVRGQFLNSKVLFAFHPYFLYS